MLIFRKRSWSRRIKYKNWKKHLWRRTLIFFWEIRKMEERKQEHISVWENLLRDIYFLLIKFSRIIYAGFHLCSFFSDVNQIFKDKLSIWMNRTRLFIVKGEQFYDWFFGIHDYLSREKFKANNERHKTEAFLNCELRNSFSKLVIH